MNPYLFIVTVPRYVEMDGDFQVVEAVMEEEEAKSPIVGNVLEAELPEDEQKLDNVPLKVKSPIAGEDQIHDTGSLTPLKEIPLTHKDSIASTKTSDRPHLDDCNEKTMISLDEGESNYVTKIANGMVRIDVVAMLVDLLKQFNLTDLVWTKGIHDQKFQVSFSTPVYRVESFMKLLINRGVSTDYGTIRVLPIDIVKPELKQFDNDEKLVAFKNSAKSRIVMDQVIARVNDAAALSFDYLCLVTIASIIAAVGLASNSVVAVVASMLISPIMGPILSFTFGSYILDKKMGFIGLRNEALSLLICVFVGFVLGIVMSPFATYFEWPTDEMSSRGTWQAIMTGIGIALPSGAGVALSVLGNNAASLVGVAISASLLPPAVNAGLLWAYAILGPAIDDNVDSAYFAELGAFSFLLTVVNIICIFLMALIMFAIKEVAPIPGKTEFWKHTIANVREQHRPIGEENERLAEMARGQQTAFYNRFDQENFNERDPTELYRATQYEGPRLRADDVFKFAENTNTLP